MLCVACAAALCVEQGCVCDANNTPPMYLYGGGVGHFVAPMSTCFFMPPNITSEWFCTMTKMSSIAALCTQYYLLQKFCQVFGLPVPSCSPASSTLSRPRSVFTLFYRTPRGIFIFHVKNITSKYSTKHFVYLIKACGGISGKTTGTACILPKTKHPPPTCLNRTLDLQHHDPSNRCEPANIHVAATRCLLLRSRLGPYYLHTRRSFLNCCGPSWMRTILSNHPHLQQHPSNGKLCAKSCFCDTDFAQIWISTIVPYSRAPGNEAACLHCIELTDKSSSRS